MPEPVATPANSVARDGNVASNISKAIADRANGKSPSDTNGKQPPVKDTEADKSITVTDPNAGKKKFVVNGREVWLTPELADAYVQKGLAFEPKMDELRRLQSEAQQFIETLKNDPAKILFNPKIGHTPEAVFQKIMQSDKINDATKETVGKWYWENVVEPAKLSPAELQAREDAKFRRDREMTDKQRADEEIKKENFEKVQRTMSHIKLQIGEAMKESGLPDNNTPLGAEMARMVADVMRMSHFNREPITPKQAIEFVKKRIKSVQTAYYDGLDPEKLVEEIGEENAKKVQKYFLKLAQESGNKPPVVPNGKRPAVRNSGDRETINLDQFHDQLAELKKKG